MPELPDVENYRRYLESTALNKRIDGVHVADTRILRNVSAETFAGHVKGHRMTRTRRCGKNLLAALDGGEWLAFHFGMTGRFDGFTEMEDDPPYDRLRFDFAGGTHLAYVNKRMLGGVNLVKDPDDFIAEHGLGPDALDEALDAEAFEALLEGRSGRIKSVLMDQELIAGIGNVYADEILFRAKIHPAMSVRHLDASERRRLHKAMRDVLETAISHGAGTDEVVEKVPKSFLLPHRTEGADCPARCGGKVHRLKFGGRSTYFCPSCQKAP